MARPKTTKKRVAGKKRGRKSNAVKALEEMFKLPDVPDFVLNQTRAYAKFEALAPEGAIAVERVMPRVFPLAQMKPKMVNGFFGPTPVYPQHISVPVSETESVQVMWGIWDVPEINGTISMQAEGSDFSVVAELTNDKQEEWKAFETALREELSQTRIYKNRAVKVVLTQREGIPAQLPPVKLSGVDSSVLILNEQVERQIKASVFTPIEKADEAARLGVPRKRGVLLEGNYGVGKTLIAGITAKKAIENGFTFFLVNSSTALAQAFDFARRYGRSVVFVEDLDQVAAQDRDTLNRVLNTIDGMDTKREEILIVATTNFVERIDPAFLRPGRFDHVVHVDVPNDDTIARMIRHFAGDLLPELELIDDVVAELRGATPAMVRETVERAKLMMLAEGETFLSGTDLRFSAATLRRQRELASPKLHKVSPPEEFVNHLVNRVVEEVAKY